MLFPENILTETLGKRWKWANCLRLQLTCNMRSYIESSKSHLVILSPTMYKMPTLFLGIFLGKRNCRFLKEFHFSSVHLLRHIGMFATPRTAACQASLSITNSQRLFKFMSIKSVMPSNYLILCCPLLFLPSIFPSIRVFPNESVLLIR